MSESQDKKAISELSVDTQLLVKRLMQVPVGDTISYREMSELIGRDVQDGARHLVASARRILQRDERIVFAPVSKLGLKRLNDTGKIGVAQQQVARVHNAAVRGARVAAAIDDYDSLSNADKVAHNTAMSLLGGLAAITTPRKVQKLTAAVEKAHEKLPLAKMLDAVRANL